MGILLKYGLCFLTSSFFYVNEPVIDMRENPANNEKVVSQAIFSEEVTLHEKSGDWALIHTSDDYSGWILSKNLVKLAKPYEANTQISRLRAHIYGVKDIEWGPITSVPYGTKLKIVDASDARWLKIVLPNGLEGYVQKGDVAERKILQKSDLPNFSKNFLGLPYTWGGRSSFGYDCSGFVQMLYNQIGIKLQRDSKQQILDSRLKVIEIDQLEPGDLLFFGKSPQRIMHVALYIGNEQFIHATGRENQPWIRISNLSDFEWSGDQNAYYCYRTARQFNKS